MHGLNITSGGNLGGHRLSLDDLLYLQLGLLDLASVFPTIIGQGFSDTILSELRIDDHGSTFDLEIPVAVIYQGEIHLVEPGFAQPKGPGGSEFKFQIVTENNANNPVIYASGTPINVHRNKKMVLVHTNISGADYVPVADFTASNWITYTPTVAGLTYAGGGEFLELKYRNFGKTLFLSISLMGQKVASIDVDIPLPFSMTFKSKGRQVFSGFIHVLSDSGEDYIVAAQWEAGASSFGFRSTHASGGVIATGDIQVYGTITAEIE